MESKKKQPTTVYLDPRLARAIKVKAAITESTVSDLVNEAVAGRLRQDEEDLRSVRERRREKGRSFEDVLRELKRDGLI